MAVKNNITLDDGLYSFTINGDANRTISFNPTDTNIVPRIGEAQKLISAAIDRIIAVSSKYPEDARVDEVPEDYTEVLRAEDKAIKEAINYIFDSNVTDAAFGNASALAPFKGKYYVERLMDAVVPVITAAIEDEQKQFKKKMATNVAKYAGKR